MSKKQSTLFSFFKGTGSTSKPSTPVRVPETPKAKKETEIRGSPLTSQGNREDHISPVKQPSAKRRRVILSSDEEDEGENVKQQTREPETPKTPKTPAISRLKGMATPRGRGGETPKVSTEMAESFISSFRFDESMNASMSESMLNSTVSETKKVMTDLVEEAEKYSHETLKWLQPENIRDANKRLRSDPEYDPTTLFVPPDFIKDQTPGHKQWWTIKMSNFDTILLFKVGKFYELYHMDAVVSVNCLSLAYMRGSYAHTGFPEAAYGKFADQLVARGYKVARIEQTETPQQLEERNKKAVGAKDKVVKRELCRITTSATKTFGVLDGDSGGFSELDAGAKYLLAVKEMVIGGKSNYGVCFIDTAIGQFNVSQFEDDDYRSFLRTLMAKYSPAQVLLERGHVSRSTSSILSNMLASVPQETLTPKKQFLYADDTVKLLTKGKYLGSDVTTWSASLRAMLDEASVVPKPAPQFLLAWSAVGAVISYLERCLIDVDMVTMNNFVTFSSSLISHGKENLASEQFWKDRNLVLDGVTISNLNLLPSSDPQASNVSLYSVLNFCNTAFGRRRLRQWICAPTCDLQTIVARQVSVEFLSSPESVGFTKSLTGLLKELPDLERLLQKIHTCGLKYRAESHPDSRAVMFEAPVYNRRKIKNLALAMDGFACCVKAFRLFQQKVEDCPSDLISELLQTECGESLASVLGQFQDSVNMKKALEDGKIEPLPGHDEDYDKAVDRVKECLADLESYRREQESVLKCIINYYGTGKNRFQMEIPESKKNLSSKYDLKGRRKGFGRYQTPELCAMIDDLTEAEKHQEKQANESARKVFEEFDNKRSLWSSVVERLSTLDVLLSLARYAQSCAMEICRPEFILSHEKPFVAIENGSHPCLAIQVASGGSSTYIANDTFLGGDQPSTMLLTGPNMGGKSTLMRQVAVLVIMAHIGALVPARSIKLSPVDRIFTRIGANDKIMCGESTFFVEMKETQLILRDATVHSLVLVDELGRGTSTFDGTAIASAVMAELANSLRCRTFFSTHYHSLCTTALSNINVLQAHMACMVENENEEDPTEESVTFLYKLTTGACPKSYGFFAAKLAGIRDEVVRHAFASSALITKSTGLDCATRLRLREAAGNGSSVDELERLVAAL